MSAALTGRTGRGGHPREWVSLVGGIDMAPASPADSPVEVAGHDVGDRAVVV